MYEGQRQENYREFATHEERNRKKLVHRLANKIETEWDFHFGLEKTKNLFGGETCAPELATAALREVCERQRCFPPGGNLEEKYLELVGGMQPEQALSELEMLHEALGPLHDVTQERYVEALAQTTLEAARGCEGDYQCVEGLVLGAKERAKGCGIEAALVNALEERVHSQAYL